MPKPLKSIAFRISPWSDMMKCSSCNKEVTDNYVRFKCPSCGNEIIRCQECRERSGNYTCMECGFEGP